MHVLDIANGGVLVQGARLLPGTHVDVHVVTSDGRVLVRSRVVRSYISDVTADAVCYRSALAFDRFVDTAVAGYLVPSSPQAAASAPGSDYPAPAPESNETLDDCVAI